MNGARWTPRVGVLLVLALALPGCSTTTDRGGEGGSRLTVYGAASLRNALLEAERRYEADHPGVDLTLSTGSSAALAAQIEAGAPADLLLSADTASPRRLVEAGLVDGSPVVFATNRLSLVVPEDNPARIETPADLARPGVTVVAASAEVPITRYAEELVANLAGEPGYPPDLADAYARNVATREENVQAVVAKVALGEGDAAIVYATDARAASGVLVIAVPEHANVVARYEGVVLRRSADGPGARAFLDWLTAPDGRELLVGMGFSAP